MEAEKPAKETTPKATPSGEITFKCRWCGQERPLRDMRRIARFSPVLVVCCDCQRRIQ